MYYPKCKPGYNAFGCCICRPPTPNCKALGYNGGLDLSCARYIKVGSPYIAECGANLQNNAGLCYKLCKTGYYGVGPVCWANAPKGWVGCGMGAASSSKACRDAILGQISSVGQAALTIGVEVATLGTATGAVTATKTA